MPTITNDQTGEYRNTSISEDVDARGATWHQRQTSGGDYPFNVTGAAGNSGLRFLGGTVLGGVPTGDWRTLYDLPNGNSAALRIENCPGAVVSGWTFKSDPALSQPRFVWDGIRFAGSTDNWIIEDVLLEGCRDDAIENEQGGAGVIRNSRFFGCFVFLGTDGLNAGGKTLTIEDTLISMGLHSYNGRSTHQSPFKSNNGSPGFNPNFVLDNVVVAIADPTHEGATGSGSRLAVAFSRMTSVTNCYWLNLSDTPLPAGYPARPAGFTTLQGQAARDYWDQRVASWGTTPPPPEENPDLEELTARVAALETAVASLNAAYAANAADIDALQASAAALENGLAALSSTVSGHGAKLAAASEALA